MNRKAVIWLSARVSVGLIGLMVAMVWAAHAALPAPGDVGRAIEARRALCEGLAFMTATAVQNDVVASLDPQVRVLMQRNPQIRSVTVRSDDGATLLEVTDHPIPAQAPAAEPPDSDQVRVNLLQGDRPWGSLQVCFVPLAGGGITGWFESGPGRVTILIVSIGLPLLIGVIFVALRRALAKTPPMPQQVRTMLNTLAEGVLVLDEQQQIVFANTSFGQATDQPPAELQGRPAGSLNWTAMSDAGASEPLPWSGADAPAPAAHKARLLLESESGLTRAMVVNWAPIVSEVGRRQGTLVSCDDVTELEMKNAELDRSVELLSRQRDEIEKHNRELHRLSRHDPLTGCMNRRAFFEEFEAQFEAARRSGESIACVMVDVDHFKKINDTHGHSAGDVVLVAVAGLLQGQKRGQDVVCRYGGEEFCLLFRHVTRDQAAAAAERYRQAIEASRVGEISITASLGVCAIDHRADSAKHLLDRADEALYIAKRTGRNRVVCWQAAGDSADHGSPRADVLSRASATS